MPQVVSDIQSADNLPGLDTVDAPFLRSIQAAAEAYAKQTAHSSTSPDFVYLARLLLGQLSCVRPAPNTPIASLPTAVLWLKDTPRFWVVLAEAIAQYCALQGWIYTPPKDADSLLASDMLEPPVDVLARDEGMAIECLDIIADLEQVVLDLFGQSISEHFSPQLFEGLARFIPEQHSLKYAPSFNVSYELFGVARRSNEKHVSPSISHAPPLLSPPSYSSQYTAPEAEPSEVAQDQSPAATPGPATRPGTGFVFGTIENMFTGSVSQVANTFSRARSQVTQSTKRVVGKALPGGGHSRSASGAGLQTLPLFPADSSSNEAYSRSGAVDVDDSPQKTTMDAEDAEGLKDDTCRSNHAT